MPRACPAVGFRRMSCSIPRASKDSRFNRVGPPFPAHARGLVSTEERAEVDAPSAVSCSEDLFRSVLSHPQLDTRGRRNQPRESEVAEMVSPGCAFASIGGVAQD